MKLLYYICAIAAINSSTYAQTILTPNTIAPPGPSTSVKATNNAAGLAANTSSTSGTTSNTRPVPVSFPAAIPMTEYTLTLAWDEKSRDGMKIKYNNISDKALKINAVQTTGSIFLVDYPRTIPPGSAGYFTIYFETKSSTQSNADIIKLKSSDGDKILKINQFRPSVATLDKGSLTWILGESTTTKTATLRLTNNVKVDSVAAMLGNGAKFIEVSPGVYLISVTPKSTVKAQVFPVFIKLIPEVPGVSPVLTCTIN